MTALPPPAAGAISVGGQAGQLAPNLRVTLEAINKVRSKPGGPFYVHVGGFNPQGQPTSKTGKVKLTGSQVMWKKHPDYIYNYAFSLVGTRENVRIVLNSLAARAQLIDYQGNAHNANEIEALLASSYTANSQFPTDPNYQSWHDNFVLQEQSSAAEAAKQKAVKGVKVAKPMLYTRADLAANPAIANQWAAAIASYGNKALVKVEVVGGAYQPLAAKGKKAPVPAQYKVKDFVTRFVTARNEGKPGAWPWLIDVSDTKTDVVPLKIKASVKPPVVTAQAQARHFVYPEFPLTSVSLNAYNLAVGELLRRQAITEAQARAAMAAAQAFFSRVALAPGPMPVISGVPPLPSVMAGPPQVLKLSSPK